MFQSLGYDMSAQYIYYEMNMPLIYILTLSFQLLLLESKLMTLYHIIYYVTTVTCLFIIQKEKRKENQRKEKGKLRKIDKNKIIKIKY